MRIIWLGLVLALGGCDMGHLGNPVMWPGMVVGGGIENASYNARRKRVSGHIMAHQAEILADIRAGGGPALTTGADLARVPDAVRPEMIRIMQSDIAKFTPDTAQAREQLVVWFMVHGN
jgi:hypothetical protein